MLDNNFPLYMAVFVITFIMTVVTERILIPLLSSSAKQPIYTEGPSWHEAKRGTPTMGGIAFVSAFVFSILLGVLHLYVRGERGSAVSLLICLFYAVMNSLIGMLDDLKKLFKKENLGLKPREKIILQSIAAAIFLFLLYMTRSDIEVISFTFGAFDLGIFFYPLSFIVLIGITNCANLTDGVDGLAGGVAFAIGVSLFYISYALSYDAAFISSALMGASSAFLIFNIHPARIFMGDTGSLFLGAIGAAASITLGNPILILFIGGIYVIEGASVIIQVISFKLTGKRVFKMSPLHHHLEKCGWSENKICITAIILTFIFSIPAFAFYLP